MTKVKICGITNLEDALLSAKFGADALGFNFYERSPRYIFPEIAREICAELPAEIMKVGVFVNESLDKVVEIARLVPLDAVQLHGDETPDFVLELKSKINLEIIKVFRIPENFKPENDMSGLVFIGTEVYRFNADSILFDTHSTSEYGGTGETFNWEIAKFVNGRNFPNMYLAGGLSPDNVGDAIIEFNPFAVDACSCLEKEKGKKDKTLLINFISNVVFERRLEFKERALLDLSKFSNERSILDLLRLFRLRPNLFLLRKSITQLCSFISGFYTAIQYPDSYYDTNEVLRKFAGWLGFRRGITPRHFFMYSEYMLEKTNGDEERAFDLFFALLEEFLLEKNIKQ